jgi:hypothetical protein
MWHEETLKIIRQGTAAGEFKPRDDMESIAWRLIALVCGLDGIYALGMQEIDDAAFNRHINYSISMELFNFKLHLVTNNPELIFARLLSVRFSYLFFIYYNRYIPIP